MSFNYDIEGELTCKVNGSGSFIAKKGSMVAYKGDFKFDKMLMGPNNGNGILGGLLGQAARKLTKENIELKYSTFKPFEYPQFWGKFEPNVSVVDYLMHCGYDWGRVLESQKNK